MNSWTTPEDLRAQVMRHWDKGTLLACLVEPAEGLPLTFPLRLTLRVPASADLSDRFDDVRTWSAQLQQGAQAGYRLVWREVRHRVIGANSLPAEAWVETLDEALRLIGKRPPARAFQALLAVTRSRQSALLPWLQRKPLAALALAGVWPLLLDLVAWVQAHPQPGVYLRQVDLPGLHSKFIETHRAVLAEWLDLCLPPEAINTQHSGASQFALRYGFRDKPARVRLRFLDPQHTAWVPGAEADYGLLRSAFERLNPSVDKVFITENEINFLAFPATANSLVIFGAGYGFEALEQARWLEQRQVFYWGDIDSHGFAILDQLRSHFGHAKSLLMDRETLLAHRAQWTDEPQPTLRDLPRLTAAEGALYDELRWQRLQDQPLRLEQERIAYGWVQAAVAATAAA